MIININNYEEYLLSYIDGELNAAEEMAFRQFMLQHPELQKELQWLEATKLPVEHEIIFRDKKSLYKQEKRSKESVFLLRRYQWVSAAAACAALLVVFYLQFQKQAMPAKTAAVNEAIKTSRRQTKHVTVKPNAISPAGAKSGEQKKYTASREENAAGVLAAASRGARGKNSPISRAKKETVQSFSFPQRENNGSAAGNSLPQLPSLSFSPVTSQKPAAEVPIAGAMPENTSAYAHETVHRRPEKQKLSANRSTKDVSLDKRIILTASRFPTAKKEMDSTITQKLTDINQKASGFIANLAKKGIKIGHITFAFNH